MTFLPHLRVNDLDDGVQVAMSAGVPFNPVSDTVLAVVTSEGNLAAGALYSRYTGAGGSCHMHVASFQRRWHTKETLQYGFVYPFDSLQVVKIFAQVHEKFTHARRFYRQLGFIYETRLKDHFEDGDLLVLSMYRNQCRFVPQITMH